MTSTGFPYTNLPIRLFHAYGVKYTGLPHVRQGYFLWSVFIGFRGTRHLTEQVQPLRFKPPSKRQDSFHLSGCIEQTCFKKPF